MPVLTIDSFAPCLNQGFSIALEESALELTLVQTKRLPVTPFPGMLREPFSLRFRSASQTVLPQRIYPMRNAVIGEIEMFIMPIARDAAGVVYEAIFN
jgi:hypothetical protein